ncbi:hypothetical protein BH11BAC3_BH11BAC3_41010 [soil metagenome]
MLSYGQEELLPSFHSNYMLGTKIKITPPKKDTANSNNSIIQIASQDILFFEPQNIYPFIRLTNKVTNLNNPTITELQSRAHSVSPLDTLSNITKFIKGKIFNNTTDTFYLTTHIGGTLIGIQEAKDEKGNWRPIEYWYNDKCGNSFDDIQLAPNEYINFFIPRYYGLFKTKIRLRFLLGAKTIISSEWDGRIDKKQFIKPKETQDKDLRSFYSFLE